MWIIRNQQVVSSTLTAGSKIFGEFRKGLLA